MNGLVLTNIGIEDISAKEIQELISASDIKISKGKIFFSCNSEQDLVDLCYHGRTFSKVVLLLSSFDVKEMPDASVLSDLKNYLDKSFVVNCDRFGEHSFTSFDAGNSLNNSIAKMYDVSIERKIPQTIFYLLIEDKTGHFGIDFSGIDLGRRDYRIFLGHDALKGNIAASLLFISGYQPKQSLLDPFCRHGIVPIEAALLSTNTSPHKFVKEKFGFYRLPNRKFILKDSEKEFSGTIIAMDDNFKHVSASKKNAKIAGVIKSIEFSRTDIQWLDAKFGKNFLDSIVAFPVQFGKNISEKLVEKIYHEIFYQAEFILKKSGKICLVLRRGIDFVKSKASEFKFSVEHERKVMQGEEEFSVILFSRTV